MLEALFERFLASFRLVASDARGEPWKDWRLMAARGYSELAGQFAGRSFEDGLYRLHDRRTGEQGEAALGEAFTEFRGRACPFAYDWLGRQFALDTDRAEGGEPLVLLLEPGTGETFEIPLSFAAFHEQLFELKEPALAASFFSEWAQVNPTLVPLGRGDCVGYTIPLFLGGSDTVDNLEVIDLDVHWSLSSQLRAATSDLPPGTSIGGFSTSE
jgi:Domain of unknown function (DUF1851)